jgi:ribosomal-protein-alanine N-acetyltransferase
MLVTIRLALEKDIPALDELYSQFTNWRFQRKEVIRKVLSDLNSELLVASDSGQIVGFVHQVFVHDIVHGAFCSYIMSLFVNDKYRRLGIASRLIQSALESAKKRRVVEVHLDTKESNKEAIRFYEKLGFEKVGTTFERKP